MPMKMKNMKGIDLFCASPASTAICSSIDQRSMVKNGTKSLHRLNSYLNDQYKTFSNNINNYTPSNAPCISELPFTPRPSSSFRDKNKTISSLKQSDHAMRRKSSADVSDLRREKYRAYKSGNYSPPSNSSRYLLGDSQFLDSLNNKSEYDTNRLALVPSTPVFRSEEREFSRSRSETSRLGTNSMMDAEKERKMKELLIKRLALVKTSDHQEVTNKVKHGYNKMSSTTKYDEFGHTRQQKSMVQCRNDSQVVKSSASAQTKHQVVVLRVSLHCRGCEGKLRRHLSKMEGVTSFSIDLESKKVTVVGNVTPFDVLTSISKVKNAQFWPSPASTSSSTSSSSSSSTSSKTEFSY